MAAQQAFLSDVQAIRDRARKHIEDGPVTPGYEADKDTVLKLLNEALATEIVCTLLYRRHYFMADGLLESILAVEEEHADKLRSMLQDVSAHFGSRSAPGHRV